MVKKKPIILASSIIGLAFLLTACSSTPSTEVEYSVHTDGAPIGTVVHHTIQGFDGAVDLSDEISTDTWSTTVDGGSGPFVTVHAPADGTSTCTIRDADGKVLVEASGTNGERVHCAVDRSE